MRRVVTSAPMAPLPIELETVGLNTDQEPIDRPMGYPCFHWLHTLDGEGEVDAEGLTWRLPPRSGILLYPDMPHRYRAKSSIWQTAYVTFEGRMASEWISSMFGPRTERIQWDAAENRIAAQWEHMLVAAENGVDRSGWELSAELYRFLTLLKTAGRTDHRPSMSRRMEKMQNLLEWMEREYADPGLSLSDMAKRLGIGERQLNERFRHLFGQTAYAYLIDLRVRKAKEKLPVLADMTVREIGSAVGFRDPSHFVATFRRKEGLTPDQYRRLHGMGSRNER
ncbi:helix-turn-helix domain-containing protein [Cohnella sp. CFH 77786]|uniref:AraC family transcriptional regulator n=1 Tax=Cohnella sp. CFH 77786 TaxID=2662265 RepID=UPI001C60ED2E|nr:helix-turn-helix domain-containing protein [Cohnella sp. CFH 77786]MBW5448600.1 helix-turn-helix domain-containing protein [Cohnella sp. CFH 77786]